MLKQQHFGEEIVDNKTAIFPQLFLVNTPKDLKKNHTNNDLQMMCEFSFH
jgi:hypothetical protein